MVLFTKRCLLRIASIAMRDSVPKFARTLARISAMMCHGEQCRLQHEPDPKVPQSCSACVCSMGSMAGQSWLGNPDKWQGPGAWR